MAEVKIKKQLPLFKVHMPQTALRAVSKVLVSGYVSQGSVAERFEKSFQKFIGNPYTALVNSGTSALTLALRMADVGPGDEVISTPMTCLATNEPIILTGAKIVWADINSKTGNIDPLSVEQRISRKTKAIMVVHWAGNPVQLTAISKIAKRHRLKVIEDAAHALGARYQGKMIGNHSDYVCFSFQAVKHLTTVDGGAIAAKNKKDYERMKLLRWFGSPRDHSKSAVSWDSGVFEAGYKMHMNDMNASIGLEQVKFMPRIVKAHRRNALYLIKKLNGIDEIELPVEAPNSASSFWIFTIKLPDAGFRRKFSNELTARGIGNGIVHSRNDKYSLFKKFKRSDLPGVNDFSSRMLNIPCGWWLAKPDLVYLVKSLRDIVAELR